MIFEEMMCGGEGKGADIYLSGDGDKDTEYLRLSFVHVWGQVWLDMRPEHLKELSDMLQEAVDKLDGELGELLEAESNRKPNLSDIARKPRPQ